MRITLTGGLYSVAHVTATVAAGYIFYGSQGPGKKGSALVGKEAIERTQWTYVGISCGLFALLVTYLFVPVPEMEDEQEKDVSTAENKVPWIGKPFRKQYFLFTAAATSYLWIGSAGSIAIFFMQYALEKEPCFSNRKAAQYKAIAGSFIAVARFASVLIMKKVKPRHLLLVSLILTVALLAAATGVRGPAGLYIIMAENFTKACISPIIDSLALRGLGKHTKKGASLLVICNSAMAVFAPIFGVIADKSSMRVATALPLTCAALTMGFAIVVNSVLASPIDALCNQSEGISSASKEEHDEKKSATVSDDSADTEQAASAAACETR
ncbi:MAG: hypothetical protein Q9162_003829 [Coniocarpon cinnabarinum]